MTIIFFKFIPVNNFLYQYLTFCVLRSITKQLGLSSRATRRLHCVHFLFVELHTTK